MSRVAKKPITLGKGTELNNVQTAPSPSRARRAP